MVSSTSQQPKEVRGRGLSRANDGSSRRCDYFTRVRVRGNSGYGVAGAENMETGCGVAFFFLSFYQPKDWGEIAKDMQKGV